MIIELLMDAVLRCLDTLFFFDAPMLPANFAANLDSLFMLISSGVGILSNFVDLPFVGVMFASIAATESIVLIYKFIMWVLRKIPMLGIS